METLTNLMTILTTSMNPTWRNMMTPPRKRILTLMKESLRSWSSGTAVHCWPKVMKGRLVQTFFLNLFGRTS